MEPTNHGLGLVGRKVAMTRVFTDDGAAIAVTVIDVSDNRVAQVKTVAHDSYSALQIAFGKVKPQRINKPQSGHLAKAKVEPSNVLKEFRVSEAQLDSYKVGAQIPVTLFQVGQKVDVQGVTLGKGFTGTIKRHHFGSQRASHGNSRSHNVPGSISMAQDPGRVFPGKRMSGQLGNVVRKVQNLSVVRIDEARNLIFVKGAVAGHDGNVVVVYPAAKAKGEKNAA